MDLIVIALIAAILGGAAFAIYRSRKAGIKCIGCPDSAKCASCTGCSGGCSGCGE